MHPCKRAPGCPAGCSAVADEKRDEKKRGARGDVKHTPGRDHARKSGAQKKKKRFEKNAAVKRRARREDLRKQWEAWDALPPEVRRLRPELKPKQPRPTDER